MKKAITDATERSSYMDKRKKARIILSVILGIGGLLYLGGILGQLIAGYQAWLGGDGISGQEMMKPLDWNLLVCIRHAFTLNDLKGMATAILLGTAVVLYVKFHDKFDGNEFQDGKFVYESRFLKGAVFEITAAEDIVTQDNQGTLWMKTAW